MNTQTKTDQKKDRVILAVMPVLPSSADIQERLNTMQAEATAALSYAHDLVDQLRTNDSQDVAATHSEIQSALVYADTQVSGLQALTEEAHAALAAVAAYSKAVTEQRDRVVAAYGRAFEHGTLHAYECAACMEDAAVEGLAQEMLYSSPADVAIEETEKLNARLEMAEEMYAEMISDEIAGLTDPDAYDRTDLLGLVEQSVGIDLDRAEEESYDLVEDDQAFIASLTSDGDLDIDEDDEDDGDDWNDEEEEGQYDEDDETANLTDNF